MAVVLQKALDAGRHAVLEMPTGTGKTVTLLALITSYQLANPDYGKLIYCTRTVPEMTKCVEELKHVMKYRDSVLPGQRMLAVCLSARRNMCVNDDVMSEGDTGSVDVACRNLTVCRVADRAAI